MQMNWENEIDGLGAELQKAQPAQSDDPFNAREWSPSAALAYLSLTDGGVGLSVSLVRKEGLQSSPKWTN